MRTLFTSLAAAAAALTLAACGSGDDGSTTPAAPPPLPSPAMHQQALAFAEAIFAFSDITMGPLYYGTDAQVRVLASADACLTGSATTQVNGGTPAAGTPLPVGNHTLETAFAACEVLPAIRLTGIATVAYSAPTSVLTGLNATGSANSLRWQGMVTPAQVARRASVRGSDGDRARSLGAGLAVDYTGNGNLGFTFDERTIGNITHAASVLRPAAGATLTNNTSRTTLTWVSGEVRESSTVDAGTGTPTSYALEYRALTFALGASQVTIDGAITQHFGSNAPPPSGEATLRVVGARYSGAPVGTLRFAADGRLVATLVADVPTW